MHKKLPGICNKLVFKLNGTTSKENRMSNRLSKYGRCVSFNPISFKHAASRNYKFSMECLFYAHVVTLVYILSQLDGYSAPSEFLVSSSVLAFLWPISPGQSSRSSFFHRLSSCADKAGLWSVVGWLWSRLASSGETSASIQLGSAAPTTFNNTSTCELRSIRTRR